MTTIKHRLNIPSAQLDARLLLKALCLSFTLMAPLSVSAHYCRFKRGDSKYLCLAKNEESLYFCRYVKIEDNKQRCVALHYGDKSYCGKIQDGAQRALCESEAEARASILEQRRAKAEAERLAQQTAAGGGAQR